MTTLENHIEKDIKIIDEILNFWFEKKPNFSMWFDNGKIHDKIIKKKFYKILEDAEEGNLLHWLSHYKSYLAYIIFGGLYVPSLETCGTYGMCY